MAVRLSAAMLGNAGGCNNARADEVAKDHMEMNHDTFDIRVGVASSMATGRQDLHSGLQAWGCGNVDDVVLVFAELVTNVLAHAGPASTTVVTHEPPSVRIEVHDTSHVIPHVRNVRCG